MYTGFAAETLLRLFDNTRIFLFFCLKSLFWMQIIIQIKRQDGRVGTFKSYIIAPWFKLFDARLGTKVSGGQARSCQLLAKHFFQIFDIFKMTTIPYSDLRQVILRLKLSFQPWGQSYWSTALKRVWDCSVSFVCPFSSWIPKRSRPKTVLLAFLWL